MRQVKIKYGWRLAGGYDLVVPAMVETPEFPSKRSILVPRKTQPCKGWSGKVRKLADEWKRTLPEEKHEEFEEILDVGRRLFRMRDERGLATDLSGVGLCRRGMLEGGRRLADQGVIYRPEHLCVAVKLEAIALLRGDLGSLVQKGAQIGPVEIPTSHELERRFEYYIATADPNFIPRALGTPPPPPDPMALPPNIRRSMGAIHTALLRGLWDEGQAAAEDDILASDDIVKGVPASMGRTEGPVCLITKEGDLQKVQQGDIIVTYSCSASFNVLIGLCSGICTDYGGMLSHAAIVVGTQHATKKFKDGDIVRIDSSTSKVSLVSRKE